MQCPVCGTIWKEGYSYCAHCGAELKPIVRADRSEPPTASAAVRCSGCARIHPPYYRFCDFCGTPLGDTASETAFRKPAVTASAKPEKTVRVPSDATEESPQEEEHLSDTAAVQEDNVRELTDNVVPDPDFDDAAEDNPDEYYEDDADGDSDEYYEDDADGDSDEYYEDDADGDSDEYYEDDADGDSGEYYEDDAEYPDVERTVNQDVHLCDYDEFANQSNRGIGIHNPRRPDEVYDGETALEQLEADSNIPTAAPNGSRYLLVWFLAVLALAAALCAPVFSPGAGLIPNSFNCSIQYIADLFNGNASFDIWSIVFFAATTIPALALVITSAMRRRGASMMSAELGTLLPLASWVVMVAVRQTKICSINESSVQVGFFAVILLHIIVLTVLSTLKKNRKR